MRIGILGLGTIGAALVEGIAEDGHTIRVSRRNAAHAADLTGRFANVIAADNQEIVDQSGIVFIGLTDAVFRDALAGLTFRPDQLVVSLMAGADESALAPLVAPARLAARMIPFPSIATGGSQIIVHGDAGIIRSIFGRRNAIFPVANETELADWLCAQAVLSPAVLMVRDTADWLAKRGANREVAERFLRELVGTSLIKGPCNPLIQALDTPGGYNQRLRNHMVDAGIVASLANGLDDLAKGNS